MFKNDWLGDTTTDDRIGTNIHAVNIQKIEENFLGFNIRLNNDNPTISSEEKKENNSGDNRKFTGK